MALINTTTTGVLGSTFYADGSGDLTIQQNGALVNKITSNGLTYRGTGSVLQVVSSVLTSSASTASSSFTASGLSVSITPSSSSSKVFIIVAAAGSQTTSNGGGIFTIYRGATNIGNATDGFTYLYSNATFTNPFRIPVNMSFLDSPATTSSTTYQVYFKTNTAGTVQINEQSTNSTITVMEIAA